MSLWKIRDKKERLVIGLMSGTSVDGVDAALVHIKGGGEQTEAKLISYVNVPFPREVRERILALAEGDFGGTGEVCRMNALLGYLYLDACNEVCRKAGISEEEVDLVGCHGQTVYHQPRKEEYLSHTMASTLQIGDPSIICEKMGVVAVSDFRVRDIAAGGQGAPLVPYTEYLLYTDKDRDVALQNIGGIGNITFLPKGGWMGSLMAFDTGPGNVLIDRAVWEYSKGELTFDEGGRIGASHPIDERLLDWLMEEEYLKMKPPKTTGRERYNHQFMAEIYKKSREWDIGLGQIVSTLTRYTAETIALSVREFLPRIPGRLIVGGGGSYNKTLISHIQKLLPEVSVMTNEELGLNSDAKEAVAFAILANETVNGICNNVPSATGAEHPVVMGKISQ